MIAATNTPASRHKCARITSASFDASARPHHCLKKKGTLAALRCAMIGLLRCAGATNIAAACRYYAVVVDKASKHEAQYAEARAYLRRHAGPPMP